MVKCPYCKESYLEEEIVAMNISKEKVPAKIFGFGDPQWEKDKSIYYFVLSCPKCETILGFVK